VQLIWRQLVNIKRINFHRKLSRLIRLLKKVKLGSILMALALKDGIKFIANLMKLIQFRKILGKVIKKL